MWAIRFLSGPQAGQIVPLTGGKHRLGRAPTCEVKINSNSVSKEHAAILVTGDKVIITDLDSRNGTFVNGVRVQNQRLNLGDKISLHDVLIDVLQVPDDMRLNQPMMPNAGVYAAPPPAWAGSAAVQLQNQYTPDPQGGPHLHAQSHDHAPAQPQMAANSVSALLYNFKIYIDNVAMPGVYSIVQTMPFRYALAAMVTIYVVIVTALSTVPVVNTTKQNIKQESVRRAKTIARNMAAMNRQAVVQNNDVGMSVRLAELEEGVTTAVIIKADGTILAPANKRGEFVNKPFVHRARREEKEMADFIDDSNLGVSVPISIYSPESGNQTVVAYAVVLYDMGALAINATQTFKLFIETLAIALLVGAILYFFLFKIVEHPIESLNTQLDDALREGRDDLVSEYQFAPIEKLTSNINSALSRIDHSGGGGQPVFVASRDMEAANLVAMMSAAAIAINAIDDRVIVANDGLNAMVAGGVQNERPVAEITDPALKANLLGLIPRMRAAVSEIVVDDLPFAGQKYIVRGQAVMGPTDPAYYLVILTPADG